MSFYFRSFPVSLAPVVHVSRDNSHGSDQSTRVKRVPTGETERARFAEKKKKKTQEQIRSASGVHTRVNGPFRPRAPGTVNGLSSFCIFPRLSILYPPLDEHQRDPSRRRDERSDLRVEEGLVPTLPSPSSPPSSPMDIAESSRTINPLLAFYVLNVPRARRSP